VEKYVPAIFVPNLEKIADANQPLISPNIYADGNSDESIEDNIITWYYTESGELKEILLNEQTSEATNNPLFLIDNAVTTLKSTENKNFKPLNTMREDATPHSNSASRSLSFSSYEHSIESNSYRYEPWTSGKSEFAVTAIRIDPSGTFHLIYQTNSGTFKTWQKISEIKKNDIGSTRYVWAHHASNWEPWSNPWTEATQNGVNMVFWNTFERDWNRSSKQIGTCSASGTTIYLAGNMRFSSEWYSWIPSTANIHFTRFEWIYNDWAHWNSSWKAKFRLWRV
jgi:hypothetical protein